MEMRLRDHSKPCGHPYPDGAYWVGTRVAETFLCKWSECPGGREIKLRQVNRDDSVALFGKVYVYVEVTNEKPWEVVDE